MSGGDKVSIGFLVFNDVAYVRAALDSLLEQTHSNLEVLIYDDCSTDGTGEICAEYARRDPRVTYTRHASNVGISRNMECALQSATGEYFMWAADDDRWAPTFVSTLLAALENRPDCVVAFCPYQLIDEADRPIADEPIRRNDYSGADPYTRLRKLIDTWDDGFGYGLFRRALIQDVKFPVWWGINAGSPYNNIYPTLFHYLSRGDFVMVDGPPLWFNRIKQKSNHSLPYHGELLRGTSASLLRHVNMHVKCVEAVASGSGSAAVAARALPIVLERLLIDVQNDLGAVGRRAVGKLRRTFS